MLASKSGDGLWQRSLYSYIVGREARTIYTFTERLVTWLEVLLWPTTFTTLYTNACIHCCGVRYPRNELMSVDTTCETTFPNTPSCSLINSVGTASVKTVTNTNSWPLHDSCSPDSKAVWLQTAAQTSWLNINAALVNCCSRTLLAATSQSPFITALIHCDPCGLLASCLVYYFQFIKRSLCSVAQMYLRWDR